MTVQLCTDFQTLLIYHYKSQAICQTDKLESNINNCTKGHLYVKIAIRGDGKSPDQKVIDMQLQAANLVYIFDVIILSVTANKSGRLTVETSFLPLNSSKGGTLKCKP